jgi:predicted alpha/beta hydrolase family esterase
MKSPPQKYDNPRYKFDMNRKVTIYCIHGAADRYTAFAKAAKYMQEKLPESVTCIHLVKFSAYSKDMVISVFAEQLMKKIHINKDKEVVLIGHSRGGLVASYAAEYLSIKYGVAIRGVIAIASPYRGSWWAKLPGLNQFSNIQQMQTGHHFLTKLSKHINKYNNNTTKRFSDNMTVAHTATRYIFIGAKRDKIVRGKAFLPYGMQVNESVYQFPNDGHLSILLNTDLYDVILGRLREIVREQECEQSAF